MLLCARDESQRIGATLAALRSAFPDALTWVADDGSHDATAEVARRHGARVVSLGARAGKGAAATRAAREALSELGERQPLFVLCDADLGDSAAELGALAAPVLAGEADLAVAAFRTRAGGGFGLALGFARRAVRARTGTSLRAPISGQRALAPGLLATLLPFSEGFGMEIGMTIDALRAGRRVVEVELELAHRATGRTPAGFLHRARQLLDFVRALRARA